MSWGLLRPTPRGWRLAAGTTRGDPISVPRASWTKKGTAFALLVANMPQLQPLSLPQPRTRTDTPIWGLRRGPLTLKLTFLKFCLWRTGHLMGHTTVIKDTETGHWNLHIAFLAWASRRQLSYKKNPVCGFFSIRSRRVPS